MILLISLVPQSRICAGMDFANQTLFITIASILWALNIEKARESDGTPIMPARDEFVDLAVVVYVDCFSGPMDNQTDSHSCLQFTSAVQMYDFAAVSRGVVCASKRKIEESPHLILCINSQFYYINSCLNF